MKPLTRGSDFSFESMSSVSAQTIASALSGLAPLPFVGAAGDEAAELGFQFGEAAVEGDLAGFEEHRDGAGALRLAVAGVGEPDAQRRVGGAQDRLDHVAALVGFGDDGDGETRGPSTTLRVVPLPCKCRGGIGVRGGGDGGGPAFGGSPGD